MMHYHARHLYSVLTASLDCAHVRCVGNEVCVRQFRVMWCSHAYSAIEIRCSGEMPCSNCQFITADCVYDPGRRDRLREFVRLTCLHLVSFTELVQGHAIESYTNQSSSGLKSSCRQGGHAEDQ
jgi:hypothetical protein